MIIDKSIGYWCEETSILDDYAYQLYVNYINKKFDKHSMCSQVDIVGFYTGRIQIVSGKDYLTHFFYKQAEFILRHDKINKIMNR